VRRPDGINVGPLHQLQVLDDIGICYRCARNWVTFVAIDTLQFLVFAIDFEYTIFDGYRFNSHSVQNLFAICM